jgi:glycosyltransferase involved in cell wall biosynthesis
MFDAALDAHGWADREEVPASTSLQPASRCIVAIPVRDEADRIGACLQALATQDGPGPDSVLLLLNNCRDATLPRAMEAGARLRLTLRCVQQTLPPPQANAGYARRLALKYAANGLDDRDILITTDADGCVAPTWLSGIRAAIAQGADAVCGKPVIDPEDARQIPASLHHDDASECRLAELLDELAALTDPDPYDPWPRHSEHSGASIAVTVAAWRAAGGIPPVPVGEDRAFIDRLRRLDMRVRHAPDVRVTVSGRLEGRAVGGMADTMRRRIVQQDEFADISVEPVELRARRLALRARLRALWPDRAGGARGVAAIAGVPAALVRQAFAEGSFGAAWARLESACPDLVAQAVRFADLPHEIAEAERLCAALRGAVMAAPARQAA